MIDKNEIYSIDIRADFLSKIFIVSYSFIMKPGIFLIIFQKIFKNLHNCTSFSLKIDFFLIAKKVKKIMLSNNLLGKYSGLS